MSKRQVIEPGDTEEGSNSQGQHLKVEFPRKLTQDYHDTLTDVEMGETEDVNDISGGQTEIQDSQLVRDR